MGKYHIMAGLLCFLHRLLLLKLDKQIGGTIYSLFLQQTRHVTWRGWGTVNMPDMPSWRQTSTARWLCGCVNSFNNTSLWFSVWIQLLCLCLIRNRFTCLVKSKPVKQELSCATVKVLPRTKKTCIPCT